MLNHVAGLVGSPRKCCQESFKMPTNVRYSASLDQPYEEREALRSPSSHSDTGSTSRTSSAGQPSASSYGGDYGSFHHQSRADSVDSLDSLGSGSGSGGGHSRQISSDGTEYIPTRSVKTNSRLAFNPMQFVKTGTSKLVKKAEEQIRHYEEVKKAKDMVKEEEETWQSNLDNWKSRRRLRSLKSIDKPDEGTEVEEYEGRRKNKTFNEMMEERSKRGAAMNIPSYDKWDDDYHGGDDGDDEGDVAPHRTDLSFDSTGSDHVFHEELGTNGSRSATIYKASPLMDVTHHENLGTYNGRNGTKAEMSSSSSSLDNRTEEYTFENAIRSYAEFAESRTKGGLAKKATPVANTPLPNKDFFGADLESPTTNDKRTDRGSKDDAGQRDDTKEMVLERAEGEHLTVVVCLRRGVDSKDFGFTVKGVRGVGTGVFVDNIQPQSPAEAAGLKTSDEILAINGEVCSLKRTHSAIVFAIKQAVYTGRLELDIYRYRDPGLVLHGRPLASSSPVQNASEELSNTNGFSNSKADVVKQRRSMFEMAASSPGTTANSTPEKWKNRRSLDVSEALKDRLASFENSDGVEKTTMANRRSKTPERNSAFKEKLASFQSLDCLDSSRLSDQSRWHNGTQNNIGEKKAAVLSPATPLRSFERTRSCEELDISKRLSNGDEWRHLDAEQAQLDRFRDERTSCLEGDPPSTAATSTLHKDTVSEYPNNTPEHSWSEQNVDNRELMSMSVQSDVVSSQDCRTPGPQNMKHGFELAKDLEETPIVGSVPNSPREVQSMPTGTVVSSSDSNGNNEEGFVNVHNSMSWPEDHGRFDELYGGAAQVDVESSRHNVLVDSDDVGSYLEFGASVDIDHIDSAPLRIREPPKEKPPPPPVEALEDPVEASSSPEVPRREIRKELWKRRSDFLGIDAGETQSYIENEIQQLSPPLVIGDTLREELSELNRQQMRNLERQRSQALELLNSPSASEIQGGHHAPAEKRLEHFGGQDLGDEEDIAQKEREIIERLELEESQWHHDRHVSDSNQLGSASTKVGNEDFRGWSQPTKLPDDAAPKELVEAHRLRELEEALRRQEESLRMEKEKLRLEQEALLRQKEEYEREIKRHQSRYDAVSSDAAVWNPIYDVKTPPPNEDLIRIGLPVTSPPLPPNKPKVVTPEPTESVSHSRRFNDLETTSTVSSLESPVRSEPVSPSSQAQTKQALFALSAAPKAKLLDGDQWRTAHRKSEGGARRDNYNNHWLVQEAEFRRLNPQTSPSSTPPRTDDRSGGTRLQNGHTALNGDHRWNKDSSPSVVVWGGPKMQEPTRQSAPCSPRDPLPTDRKSVGDNDRQVVTPKADPSPLSGPPAITTVEREPGMLSVSGKKKCSHCGKELGRGAAMIIESLQLFYHIGCFKCCVCHVQLGNGTSGADVRVRSQKLHCHNCYSNDEGLKFSKV